MAAPPLYILVRLWIHRGLVTEFEAYERQVSRIMVRYGGVIERVIRTSGASGSTIFHTSHPGLAAALRRDPLWVQITAQLHGDNKLRSRASIIKAGGGVTLGYGGHFRAIQGFRYVEGI